MVGIYKRHQQVYQLACDRLSMAAATIAFLSSNGWDAHAAAAFGIRAVWCNRSGQKRDRLPGNLERKIDSLTDVPALVTA